jgi:hypothetical protein
VAKKSQKKAQASDQGESVSGYFRAVFKERPDLLGSGSNKALLARWLDDHPGETEVPGRVKNILSNIKSVLRKKRRKGAGTKKSATAGIAPAPATISIAARKLEPLEEQIDDCLVAAKALDRDGLATVISLLRRARNEIVWRIGQ